MKKILFTTIACFGLWYIQFTKAQLLVELKSPNTQNTSAVAYHQVRLLPGFNAKATQHKFEAKIKNICWQVLPILGTNNEKLNLPLTNYNVVVPNSFTSPLVLESYYKIAKADNLTETYYVQLKQTQCTSYQPNTTYAYYPLFNLIPNTNNVTNGAYSADDLAQINKNTTDDLAIFGGEGKFCGVVIVLPDQEISQAQLDQLTDTKICYAHDAAGNLTGAIDCSSPRMTNQSIDLEKYEKIEEEQIVVQQGPIDLGDSFVAYPNPTDGLFYLAWKNSDENQITNIQLVSMSGVVSKVNFKNTDKLTTIDLSTQPAGLYILQIVMSNGATKTIKVIRN